MSTVSKITKENGDIDYQALGQFLITYEKKLEEWEKHLKIDRKSIADALVEQHGWAAYYDQIRVDLDTAVSYFDIELDKRAEEIYSTLKEHSGYSHSETAIKRLILGNTKYVQLRRLRLELVELRDIAKSISDQFYQRSFTLRNYIKMVELEAQDIIMSL